MAKIAMVYHSGYGHTERMAQAVAEGAGATLIAINAEGDLETENLFDKRVAVAAVKFRG